MKNVIIGSSSQLRLKAVREGFLSLLPGEQLTFTSVKVATGISNLPMSNEEIYTGATNRMRNARFAHPDGDYFVGVEVGVDAGFTFSWICIENRYGERSKARSASFYMPFNAIEKINQGAELGDLIDDIFYQHNTLYSSGIASLKSGIKMSRLNMYREAVQLAVFPLLNKNLYAVGSRMANSQVEYA